MGFPRQEYWNGLLCPPPGDLPHPGIEPSSPALAGGFFAIEPLGKPIVKVFFNLNCNNVCHKKIGNTHTQKIFSRNSYLLLIVSDVFPFTLIFILYLFFKYNLDYLVQTSVISIILKLCFIFTKVIQAKI